MNARCGLYLFLMSMHLLARFWLSSVSNSLRETARGYFKGYSASYLSVVCGLYFNKLVEVY